jgi:hypothetical protein
MSAIDQRQKELEDIELKLRNAREAAAAPSASEREKSDLRLIEQEYVAAQRKARDAHEGAEKPREQPSDNKKKLDKKLDSALKDTFPSSDPVAVAEPSPVQDRDRALPEVKASDKQAPEKAKAARKSKAK